MTKELTLEDFDAMIEAESNSKKLQKPKRNLMAIENSIVNVDVAARLAAGDSVEEVARDLGVGEETVRKRMRKGQLKDLIAIEARRLMGHMSTRDLSKEKYLALATSVTNFVNAESRIREREDGLGPQSKQINIQELNILFSRRGREDSGEINGGPVQELGPREIQQLPEDVDREGNGEAESVIPGSRED